MVRADAADFELQCSLLKDSTAGHLREAQVLEQRQ